MAGKNARSGTASARGAVPLPGRNIILFADGTGNSSRSAAKSNVWRLYEAVDSGPPAPGDPVQLVHYIDGVGTSSFRWLAYLGQAFGFGLSRKVKALYEFLCRHYQPGDHIYVFGFSRGAFTARVLVDLIASCGILDRTKPAPHKPQLRMYQEEGFRLGIREAYRTYRHKYWRNASAHLNLANAIWERLVTTVRWMRGNKEPMHSPDHFMEKFAHEPLDPEGRKALRCIGVWDTVDAYGMPVRELAVLIDRLVYPYQFRDQKLSPVIHRALQALSLDDKRKTFHPLLWDERPPPAAAAARRQQVKSMAQRLARRIRPGGDRGKGHTGLETRMLGSYERITPKTAPPRHVDPRIRQVWFAGMHADVGGGYPEPGLAMVAADWMAKEVLAGAQTDGVRVVFKPDHLAEFENARQATAHMHDSRAGAAAYFRYGPRDVDTLCGKVYSNPTVVVETPKIHRSVLDRLVQQKVGYAPVGLPERYEITDWRGASENRQAETAADAGARAKIQERTWNHIFWRVFTYYGMLFPTIVLLALPAIRRIAPVWFAGRFASQRNVISDALDLVGKYLSDFGLGFLEPWLSSWAEAPSVFLAMLLFGLGCYFWSGWFIQRNVQKFAEAAVLGLRTDPPASPAPLTVLTPAKRFERLAGALMSGNGFAGFLRDAGETLFFVLTVAFTIAVLIGLGWAAVAVYGLVSAYAGPVGAAVFAMLKTPMVWWLLGLGLLFAGVGSSSRSN